MKKSIILLSSLLLLAGCGSVTNSTVTESNASDAQVSESAGDTDSGDDEFVETGFLTYEDEYTVSGLSQGGVFSSLGIDVVALVTDREYQGTLSKEGYVDKSLKFEMSVPGIIEISGDMDSITIKGIKEGGTVLTVRDSAGLQLYTKAINVRSEKSPTELSKYVYEDVNYYYPVMVSYDTYRITFDSINSGIFYAKEGDNDYGSQAFTYTYSDKKVSVGIAEYYVLNVTMTDDYASLKLEEIYLAVNGSGMVPYDNSGIAIQIFKAVF